METDRDERICHAAMLRCVATPLLLLLCCRRYDAATLMLTMPLMMPLCRHDTRYAMLPIQYYAEYATLFSLCRHAATLRHEEDAAPFSRHIAAGATVYFRRYTRHAMIMIYA